jgi:hypothetical protein
VFATGEPTRAGCVVTSEGSPSTVAFGPPDHHHSGQPASALALGRWWALGLVAALTSQPGVESVDHLHVWSLDSETVALSVHLVLESEPALHDAQILGLHLKEFLSEHYGIDHATLEYESHTCSTDAP